MRSNSPRVLVMTVLGVLIAAVALATGTAVWNQDFLSQDAGPKYGWFDRTTGWSGTVDAFQGVATFQADDFAFEGFPTGPFSVFDGVRDTWPGAWTAELDIFLDPAWSSGSGFDYSVAALGTDGAHRRDFIFHVAKDTSTGKLLVGGSNNSRWVFGAGNQLQENLETKNHFEVTEPGWYTFQHQFYDAVDGSLAVDLNLVDSSGTTLFTETRNDTTDTIPDVVGGNFYSWFTFIEVDGGISVDNHQLFLEELQNKNQCKKGGWEDFGFENQGQCVQAVLTGK